VAPGCGAPDEPEDDVLDDDDDDDVPPDEDDDDVPSVGSSRPTIGAAGTLSDPT
jgi:hypothetical protein